ncbi:serine/threonine-protein kinase [Dactylosporangium aurantiacum]|uniref:serine/threonine-protein kinase n=1 Tax=Dactylosporangium aurantiacum TaxID=35754 RepID=UPI000693B32B|nr:serine/threonine-protein kinase [Dactylosporangium aurantiacum]MDG6102517.1 serine/threonine-protein kinase [Dactylosporangium aurantiacum]
MQEGQLINGRYRLGAQLGEGGMSVVWQARDEVLDRSVAVKVLAGPFAGDADWHRRIRVEARAAASLSHPNVTNVYDYGETAEGSPFVVMELLRGPTLAQRLTEGPLHPAAAIRVCAEVAAGLAAAHAEQLVHRDVKPGNVVLTAAAAKLVDFGIVGTPGDPGSGLDADGLVLGTPAYLAPERLVGDDAVPASDVYAFGLLLYRCLTGRLPWDSETTTQMLRSHVTVAPEPLPQLPGVPPQVRQLCMRCLVKAPAARPSAEEAAAVLAEAAGITPRPELALVRPAPGPAAAAGTAGGTPDATAPADATALVVALSGPAGAVTAGGASAGGAGEADPDVTGALGAEGRPHDDGATGPVALAAPGAAPVPRGEGATDVIGDDAGDRRRVLAGLAVVVAVAALLVTFVLNRPADTPRAAAEAARATGRAAPPAGGQTGSPSGGQTPAADGGTGGSSGAATGAGAGQGGQGGGPGGGPGAGPAGGPGGAGAGGGPGGNAGGPAGGGPSGGQGGAAPPPAGNPVRIGTPGGVIVAVCGGGKVNVTGAEPAAGGTLVSLQSGPRDKSRVEFNVAGVRLRYEVRCVGGVPVATPD